MRRSTLLLLLGVAALTVWWRRRRATAAARAVTELAPRSGERVLAVGVDARAAIAAAARLAPGGTLELVDDRREHLDAVLRAVAERRLEGVVATQASPPALPFPDGAFDAAFAWPGARDETVEELRRVVRPGGRVVVVGRD